MNYLAHAALAQPDIYSIVGNLLGDFCKGISVEQLQPQILAGLQNHRAVDRFTDQHPLVRVAKQQFSAARRRFAPIALDVLFDHYLIQHWSSFYPQPFDTFKAQLYSQLASAEHLMPQAMQRTMHSVRTHDWFAGYARLDYLAMALDRIASRIRFNHRFYGIITEIQPQYRQLEQLFLQFYPELQQHVQHLALER